MDMKTVIDMKGTRKTLLDAADTAYKAKDQKTYKEKMDAVKSLNTDIEAAEDLLAESGRFADGDKKMISLSEKKDSEKKDAEERRSLDDIRGCNEYAKSFQQALLTHQSRDSSRGIDDFGILHKALTITGGDPIGEDGGFLVPVDFDKKIILEIKDFVDLAGMCNVETVNTNTGWRAVETAGQRTKLPEIAEMGTLGKTNQPKFTKVSYALRQFGDRLPVSNPLMQDVDGLMSYVAGWFGPKLILTKNSLILALLAALTFNAQTANTDATKVKAIKSILNKSLNTAHSRAASLLTNSNVYDEMDGWADTNGRPFLVPDPTQPDVTRFKGRPVIYSDVDEIPAVTVSTVSYNPLYIGNFKKFATVFDRNVMEMAATNIGGDAWATNSTEIRVITRLDAETMDSAAVYYTGYAAT